MESLLRFTTESWLLQTLCGGVHILDFYTREPDLYSTILPECWRDWFKKHDIMDILDFLMREDLEQFTPTSGNEEEKSWRGGPAPPEDLLQYVRDVRRHSLVRDFPPPGSKSSVDKDGKSTIARSIAVGMKVKKVHEVSHFASYVSSLTATISSSGKKPITHIADFGSGQNYLGRALAAPPYSKHVVALESKPHNIEGAKEMDVKSKLVDKPVVMRNKKEWRERMGWKGKKMRKKAEEVTRDAKGDEGGQVETVMSEEPALEFKGGENGQTETPKSDSSAAEKDVEPSVESPCGPDGCPHPPAPAQQTIPDRDIHPLRAGNQSDATPPTTTTTLQVYNEGHGSVQYVQHIIKDGNLAPVITQLLDPSQVHSSNLEQKDATLEEARDPAAVPRSSDPNLMIISLHSCGNLVHHGLRSLILNPAVSAVAMVGCCYNLMTERLGPPTYKLPTLRANHPRLEETANAFDPHGFPMSERLATYPLPYEKNKKDLVEAPVGEEEQPKGLRLNITARMMAVQAPYNWGPSDSDLFFTRHFYRALLQRIFLDRGVVAAPSSSPDLTSDPEFVSAAGHSSRLNYTPPGGRGPGLSSNGTSTPLTIGTLRKFAYADFISYVRAAISKLTTPNTFCEVDPDFISGKMEGLSDEEIREYEELWKERKKELSVMWGLMAFSAGVVEAVVVTDRWLWLKEQKEVETAWVEAVFEYKYSPRNLVVVGIKK